MYGPYLHPDGSEFFAHEMCILWANDIYLDAFSSVKDIISNSVKKAEK
jgi:hypothetical protein